MSGAPEGTAGSAAQPVLEIKGDATAEEVAAVVAVLQGIAAARAAAAPVPGPRRSEWSAPHRLVRQGHHRSGPGAWKSSALPRS